jgi:hypothetical protein
LSVRPTPAQSGGTDGPQDGFILGPKSQTGQDHSEELNEEDRRVRRTHHTAPPLVALPSRGTTHRSGAGVKEAGAPHAFTSPT